MTTPISFVVTQKIAYHARLLSKNLGKKTTKTGDLTSITLFDEDPVDRLQGWNHTLINIEHSPEMAEKIKLDLRR